MDLEKYITNIPDFPKKGIIFRDITTLISNKDAFKEVIRRLADQYKNKGITSIVGIEARGFIFGAALAYELGAKFVPARKKGKLPRQTYSVEYDLEYGKDSLEMHKDALGNNENVLIIDDLLATGGTIKAVIQLLDNFSSNIKGIVCVIELDDLKGREKLAPYPVTSLIHFKGE
ncbi:MAG: adenine phosphoribosyltransferase [Candidatus Omnitrophica bacterium]|nr:adenine phosphoribosyltransferase [Candidatus Omnitrophota bacterium]